MTASEQVTIARRAFVKAAGLVIACEVAGVALHLAPAQARAAGATMRAFSEREATTFGRFAETLVPGAVAAGVVEFVDSQLVAPPADSLLIAKYFGVEPPYLDFYRAGLAALEAASGGAFADLAADRALALAAGMLAAAPPGWSGPPASLFYLCARGDAIDVVYGTPAGFEALGVPYMEHILPPRRW